MKTVNELIPQRPPFQFIDQVIKLVPGEEAVAKKLITINEWFFKNTDKNNLFVPNTILIESLAQTGAATILSIPDFDNKNAFFGGIKAAEFFKRVQPGDLLELSVKMKKIKGPIGIGEGIITCSNTKVCDATLIFIVDGGMN